jgi:hypothetical protein
MQLLPSISSIHILLEEMAKNVNNKEMEHSANKHNVIFKFIMLVSKGFEQ